jgi:hypothetical protein
MSEKAARRVVYRHDTSRTNVSKRPARQRRDDLSLRHRAPHVGKGDVAVHAVVSSRRPAPPPYSRSRRQHQTACCTRARRKSGDCVKVMIRGHLLAPGVPAQQRKGARCCRSGIRLGGQATHAARRGQCARHRTLWLQARTVDRVGRGCAATVLSVVLLARSSPVAWLHLVRVTRVTP